MTTAPPPTRRRVGLALLYLVAAAITFGGFGDLTIRRLFAVHVRYLTNGSVAEVPAATASLIIHILHALGGGLIGIGIASFALIHYGLRAGQRWAGVAMIAAIVSSEGMNAIGMYAVGSFYYVSLTFIALAVIGLVLAWPETRRS